MFIMDVDKENSRLFTFEQLGRLFHMLGIFYVIKYNEENKCKLNINRDICTQKIKLTLNQVEDPEVFYSNKQKDQERRTDEVKSIITKLKYIKTLILPKFILLKILLHLKFIIYSIFLYTHIFL